MAGSDYSQQPGGKLRLKGSGDARVKKHKHKSKRKEGAGVPSAAAAAEPAAEPAAEEPPPRTDAQRKFDEIRRLRLDSRIHAIAGKSHRELIREFNERLESESEHHDMPKIGPG